MKRTIGMMIAFMPWVLMIGIWIGYSIGHKATQNMQTIAMAQPAVPPWSAEAQRTSVAASLIDTPTQVAQTATNVPEPPTATIAPKDTPEPSPTPEQPTANQATSYSVNQDVHVGDVRWKVLEAKDLGNTLPKTDNAAEKKTNGKFVWVRIEVENLSKEQLSFSSVDIKDDQDRTFTSSDDFAVFEHVPSEEHCSLAQLNANLPKTCAMIYEVPTTAKGFKANVGDLKIFGTDAWIDLGF